MTGHRKWSEIKHKAKEKSRVETEEPEFVREFLITCCAFGDEDLVPVCLFAAIKPPDDLPNRDIPQHLRQLLAQIVNEMPMHMRAPDAYGRTPNTGDLFWECAANPQELEEGKEVAWLSDSERLQWLHAHGFSLTSFLDEEDPQVTSEGDDDVQ